MMEATRGIAQQQPAARDEIPIPMELRPEVTTPVYGTAQPTAGPAAQLRRRAYSLPMHDPKHWLLLLAADRAESSGNLAREAVTPGRQGWVLRHFARQARSYPRGYGLAGALLLGGLLLKARRRRR